MEPFVKWVGGKKRLFNTIKKNIPKEFNNYVELFVGGGFLFLNFEFKNCLINDLNDNLINVYKCIKEDVNKLVDYLDSFKDKSNDYFLIRDEERNIDFYKKSHFYKAARFIFLNKNCFNGLYRENSKGYFNVPKGKYKKIQLYKKENLVKISNYLNSNNIKIMNSDFESLYEDINKNDFVYMDPPYDPIDKTKSFTSYTKYDFKDDDQKRLKCFCDRLDKKGVKFMLSNNDTPLIRELYKKYQQTVVCSTRMVGAKSSSRIKTNELIITNYKLNEN